MSYGVSSRAAAALTTAAWIDAGLITEKDTQFIVDHKKIVRAQDNVMNELKNKTLKYIGNGNINCILFDSRKDVTKVKVEVEGSSRFFPGSIKEEHYTTCMEPVEWMIQHGVDKTFQALGGDSTNVNTGWEGGVIKFVELKLDKKLNWLICALHTNELPLRHLIVELDGKTLSNNKWSGDLGKLLDTVTDLEINKNFEMVTLAYGYRILTAIRSGVLPENLINLEIGRVSHSRWLTTANRFCRLWVSVHFLTEKNLRNLRLIIEFIVGVYFPCWFQIKVKHSWIDGPRHILFQLKQLKFQKKEVFGIVIKTVKRSAWFAFSECIIQTLLCSNNEEERKFGVQKILEIRGEGDDNTQFGDDSVRSRKTPCINTDADKLTNLIDWKDSLYEPLLTTSLTTHEIRNFFYQPMVVPDRPCHSQSIERCVKQVTEACSKTYSHEKREGYIRAQDVSRSFMSKNNSKFNLAGITNFK
ncbi:uncharacterized protein LOC136092430 [Hydra vulgaris]|uniref:Uncharacterized protein LOC136092430 n=1 Tax=Hydra vulgaris TaxID=6087 RepID=A0ABM4DQ85_HYDVU